MIVYFLFYKQIGISTGAPEFSDRDKYPYFMRVLPGFNLQDYPIALMLKQYNWKMVGVLYNTDVIFISVRTVNSFLLYL